jgi:aminoglycoside phosphotransferase (APT) family kinase protein
MLDPKHPALKEFTNSRLLRALNDPASRAQGHPTVEQMLERYGQATGKLVDPQEWDWIVAWTMFRTFVMTQGIASRFELGTLHSEDAALAARLRECALCSC